MDGNDRVKELPCEDSGAFLLRKVEQALAMSPEERFLAGGEQFEFACEGARAGIRANLNDPDPAIVEERLRERFQMQDMLEQNRPR